MRRTTAPPAPPLRLALLLYPGCMPAGLFATADLARAANLRAQRPVITTCWAGADLQPVPTWEGPALTPTGWLRAPLQQQFGAVHWRFDEPLVEDGPITTAAGANGYLPLMLHALATRLDAEALADLQSLLMLPRPRTTHPAFAGHDLMAVADAELRRAMLWVQRCPATALRLPALAEALGLSPRTLARRVQAHTGLSSAPWMRRIKLRQVSEGLRDQ